MVLLQSSGGSGLVLVGQDWKTQSGVRKTASASNRPKERCVALLGSLIIPNRGKAAEELPTNPNLLPVCSRTVSHL